MHFHLYKFWKWHPYLLKTDWKKVAAKTVDRWQSGWTERNISSRRWYSCRWLGQHQRLLWCPCFQYRPLVLSRLFMLIQRCWSMNCFLFLNALTLHVHWYIIECLIHDEEGLLVSNTCILGDITTRMYFIVFIFLGEYKP